MSCSAPTIRVATPSSFLIITPLFIMKAYSPFAFLYQYSWCQFCFSGLLIASINELITSSAWSGLTLDFIKFSMLVCTSSN